MMSKTQWYILTTVRLVGLVLLILVVGNRVQQMALPTWMEMLIGAVVVILGTAPANTWVIKYETYQQDAAKRDRED